MFSLIAICLASAACGGLCVAIHHQIKEYIKLCREEEQAAREKEEILKAAQNQYETFYSLIDGVL